MTTREAFEAWCASMGFIPTQARYETWQAAIAAAINKICADVQAAGFANGGIETPADVVPEILFQVKEKIEAATAAALAAPATAPDELDQLRKDAERYRWLGKTTHWVSSKGQRINVRDFPKSWDEHIDDAMKDKP